MVDPERRPAWLFDPDNRDLKRTSAVVDSMSSDVEWVFEGKATPMNCPHCGEPLHLPGVIRATGRTRTEAKRNAFKELLRAYVRMELDEWRGPERTVGYSRSHVHELVKAKLTRLRSFEDYRAVPEAHIKEGRLDMAYVSRLSNELVAAFEIDTTIKRKSARKLASLPVDVLKFLVTMNPDRSTYLARLRTFRDALDQAGIVYVVIRSK